MLRAEKLREHRQVKLEYDLLSQEYQERLYQTVTEQELQEIVKYLDPKTWQMVVEERSSEKKCGYPLCDQIHVARDGNYRITSSGIVDGKLMRFYCCKHCYVASEYLSSQLSTDALYIRNFSKMRSLDILPPRKAPLINKMDALVTEMENVQIDIVEREPEEPVEPLNVQAMDIEGYTPKTDYKATSTENTITDSDIDTMPFDSSDDEPVMPVLSDFGKIWNLLSDLITPDTRVFIKTRNLVEKPLSAKKLQMSELLHATYTQYIQPLVDVPDLAILMETFDYRRVVISISRKQQLILCLVFVHWLTDQFLTELLDETDLDLDQLKALSSVINF
ncbi:hypothetical protein EDD86DRAFT_212602 [Gorgonomyces haynaldii]|nr:hypothetical protein EDD86DRAFT_212602 [Gorgonomyces haynaldii]